LPEILGSAAVYFKDNDMESALKAMEKILRNENYRQRFITLGLEQIKKYNWDDCARETLKIYQQVL
jgi:alpha-1,3-rhamnosyl/mannosyltransferase